ncbi:MAG: T9SS type A sorting domain-containing protein [Ignavibacteriales bacterium]|nr:T9SS type A sorting domain-containing protein [Ignavibacteriales bacterium]
MYIILSLAYVGTIYCQSFRISDRPAEYYSVDKFANEIYYADFFTYDIYAHNFNDSTTRLTTFQNLPAFANTSHKCAYGKNEKIKIFDFDSGTNFIVMDSMPSYFTLTFSFSPTDKYLFFQNFFISFVDSSIHQTNVIPFYDLEAEWVNDSIIIFTDQYIQNVIYQIDLTTELVDTFLIVDQSKTISSYSFNRDQELLYYSTYDSPPIYPKIHQYNPLTSNDIIVFDSEVDDSNHTCWDSPIGITSLGWSPDFQRLAFFGFLLTNSGAGIYTIDANSNRLNTYAECGDYGLKYVLKWINNDTVAFFNATVGYIFGHILDKTLNVDDDPNIQAPSVFKVSAYPNPFNNLLNIVIDGGIKEPVITIYNIMGEKIYLFEGINGSENHFQVIWNGQDQFGRAVSSGVYFIVVTDKLHPFILEGKNKIIYLK